jgi:hypothetical protein
MLVKFFPSSFTDQKMQFSIKDVQATGEAFSPRNRTTSPEKMKLLSFNFLFFRVIFVLLVRITNPDPDLDPGTPLNLDPDLVPQHCF